MWAYRLWNLDRSLYLSEIPCIIEVVKGFMEWTREENLSIFKVTVLGRLSRATGTPIKLCVFGTNDSARLAWVCRSLANLGFIPGGGRIRSLSSSRSRRRVALVFSSISFAPGGGDSANKVRALSSEYKFFPGQFSFVRGTVSICRSTFFNFEQMAFSSFRIEFRTIFLSIPFILSCHMAFRDFGRGRRVSLLAVLKKADVPPTLSGHVDAAAAETPANLQAYINSLKPKVSRRGGGGRAGSGGVVVIVVG